MQYIYRGLLSVITRPIYILCSEGDNLFAPVCQERRYLGCAVVPYEKDHTAKPA